MNKYKAFLSVFQCKSITVAAEELHVSQSAVSQALKSLEKEFGMQLFVRSHNGVELTYEGAQLLPHFKRLTDDFDRLDEAREELTDTTSGVIRIALFETFSTAALPYVLRAFRRENEEVRFEIHEGYYRAIEELVRHSRVDFAITNLDTIKGVEKVKLFDDPLVLAVSADHPYAGRSRVDFEDLRDESFIALDEGEDRDYINLLKARNIRLNVRYALCDYSSVVNMVRFGLGAAIVPRLALREAITEGIVTIPISPRVSRPIGVVYGDKDELSVIDRRFLNCLKAECRNFQGGVV